MYLFAKPIISSSVILINSLIFPGVKQNEKYKFLRSLISRVEITDTSVTLRHKRRGLVTSRGATPSSPCLFHPTYWGCGSTSIYLQILPVQHYKGHCMSPAGMPHTQGSCPREAMAFGSGMPRSLPAIPFVPLSLIGMPCANGACPRE